MEIPISVVKRIREEIGATHLVLFAIDENGSQSIATHGETEKDAVEAANAGNKLKNHLGWPETLCRSKPIERTCKNCTYYDPDYGIHCFNGWSDDGSNGSCRHDLPALKTSAKNKCSRFQPK